MRIFLGFLVGKLETAMYKRQVLQYYHRDVHIREQHVKDFNLLMSNIALHFIFVIIYLNENQVFHFFTAAVFFLMESVQKDVEKTPKCCNECNNRQIDVRLTTVFV